jgi:hypothetical protein
MMQYLGNKIADKFHNALLNKLIHAPVNVSDTTSVRIIKKIFLQDLNNGKFLYKYLYSIYNDLNLF